jgi:hypothetical protein
LRKIEDEYENDFHPAFNPFRSSSRDGVILSAIWPFFNSIIRWK